MSRGRENNNKTYCAEPPQKPKAKHHFQLYVLPYTARVLSLGLSAAKRLVQIAVCLWKLSTKNIFDKYCSTYLSLLSLLFGSFKVTESSKAPNFWTRNSEHKLEALKQEATTRSGCTTPHEL